jgi:murein DD-endopeptidase MepM/ murein hydrolase activator NlpD
MADLRCLEAEFLYSNPTANFAGFRRGKLLSKHKATGGFRSASPAADRSPQGGQHARRRASEARPSVAVKGLGQKMGVVAAASGLALTVLMPTTSAVGDQPAAVQPAAAPVAEPALNASVSAAAGATVDFTRSGLSSSFDADDKLHQVMVASGGDIQRMAAKGTLSQPIAELKLTSPFGYRISPITGASGELHTGQDYGSACGTPVQTAAGGTVKSAGWHAYGGGNRVEVDHGNGLVTTYNHMSAIDVKVGQALERGDGVGKVGSTGASTGCHLHFEVMLKDKHVDPLGWL